MEIAAESIRAYRLGAHHLDQQYPLADIEAAAGACGLQNSPPGAWETALFNRLEGCTLDMLHQMLYQDKRLLQAWSYRGVPVVFPTSQSAVFLTPLSAEEGEQPWIYTRGITAALDFVQMSFDELLPLVMDAARYLDNHRVKSKEALDQVLAELVEAHLPEDKQRLWQAPSMYGRTDRQTVGEAAVSFMLRPCAFAGLVVFGQRQSDGPEFTSLRNWLGRPLEPLPDAEKALVRKYLHCYGPAGAASFREWLGCSPQQAKRLWNSIIAEIEPVHVQGKTLFMLSADLPDLLTAEADEDKIQLLGAHDPYLELRDRTVILENQALHKLLWQTVANPGAVLKGGRVIGHWRTKLQKDKIDITLTLYEQVPAGQQTKLEQLAQAYAAFRGRIVRSFKVEKVE